MPAFSFQDPYATYLARLANKLASNQRLASSSVQKEKTRLERESDRTSWFGEDLDKASKKRKVDEEARKEQDLLAEASGAAGVGAGVGKYLEEQKKKKVETGGGFGFGGAGAGGAAAKKRKGAGGGFGDFSAW